MTLVAALLDPYLRDWLDLLLRWLHVIAAITWIGSSFYFVLLDQSLRPPKEGAEEGVGGELWEVHGGGFYHVQKYRVAPRELPDHLAWFKWEAYTTWISGFALMIVLYWADAGARLIDPDVADLGAWEAVGLSAVLLLVAWVCYDAACRLLRGRDTALAVVVALLVVASAWGSAQLFSPRAAWLQTGAMIGTVMVANVFFNIIPAHRELIRAKQEGREPDPAPGIEAKRRSVHNNYLTLPVLVTMLAGHFSFLTGREHAWVALVGLMALGAWVRHFYNLRHGGRTHWWMAAAAVLATLVAIVLMRPERDPAAGGDGASGGATTSEVAAGRAVFEQAGCADCHALADAGSTASVGPDLDQLQPGRQQVRDIVKTGRGGMPSFDEQLSDEQIDDVAAYVAESAGDG